MGKFKDLTGQRFGRLLVIKRTLPEPGSRQGVRWICKCDCGRGKTALGYQLTRGYIKSCGCLRSEHARSLILKVGNRKGRDPKKTTPTNLTDIPTSHN